MTAFDRAYRNNFNAAGSAARSLFWEMDPKKASTEVLSQAGRNIRDITGWTLGKMFGVLKGTVSLAAKSLLLIPIPFPGVTNTADLLGHLREAVRFDTRSQLDRLRIDVRQSAV